MAFKDLFSRQATDYARFRPSYPPQLFAWLAAACTDRRLAVDVGAGNGPAAAGLAPWFEHVIAVAPSDAQLGQGATSPRISYRTGAAEATGLDEGIADLVVAAQAFHWFDHPRFFAEVRRVTRPRGVLAFWCYGLAAITPALDAVVFELYEKLLGPYWEPERRLVESGYKTIAVPFDELDVPAFTMNATWSFAALVGYLRTWSPLKKYAHERGHDAVDLVLPRLERAWGDDTEHPHEVRWPLHLRAFRL